MMLPIDRIHIGAGRRKTEKAKVKALADSIALLGLRTPITVLPADSDGRYRLVAGRNRVEACRLLGHTEIAAGLESNRLLAEMWEIAENFHRSELTAIQRSILVGRWMKLAAKMPDAALGGHPVARTSQVAPGGHLRGIQPYDQGLRRASRALGIPRTTVERAVTVANHLTKAAQHEAERLGLAKNMRALADAAGSDGAEEQVACLRRTAERIGKRKQQLAQMKAVIAGTDKPGSVQEAFDRWFNSFDIVMKVQIRIWLLSKEAEAYFEEQEQLEQRRKAMH